jgi:hypothetical protein
MWNYCNQNISLKEINEKGYDSESVFAANGIYAAVHHLNLRNKFKDRVQTLLWRQLPFGGNK